VPVLVCLEEEALGVLSPRTSRAAEAELACLRKKGLQAAAQHALKHALPFSGLAMIRGTASPF
jgi:hypothetical protein